MISLEQQTSTDIPIIIEGQFQVLQRFSSSKLVLKTVESCFVALNYYGNGSTQTCVTRREIYVSSRRSAKQTDRLLSEVVGSIQKLERSRNLEKNECEELSFLKSKFCLLVFRSE